MSPVSALGLAMVGFILLAAFVTLLRNGSAASNIISSLGTAYSTTLTAAKS